MLMMHKREILHSGILTLGIAGIQVSQMMLLCQIHSNVQRTQSSLSLIPSILELVYCLILKIAIFCTILSSRNDDVDELNHAILNRFPGELQVFQSADSIEDNEGHGEEGDRKSVV